MPCKAWRHIVPFAILLLSVACSSDEDSSGGLAGVPVGATTGFCNALVQIANAEPAGFSSLRSQPISMSTWGGRVVPAGFRTCAVEGSARFRAEYVCWGNDTKGDDGSALQGAFVKMAKEVDSCLASNIRNHRYERSQTFNFAGGEQVVIWRDMTGGPGPGFSLKIKRTSRRQAITQHGLER